MTDPTPTTPATGGIVDQELWRRVNIDTVPPVDPTTPAPEPAGRPATPIDELAQVRDALRAVDGRDGHNLGNHIRHLGVQRDEARRKLDNAHRDLDRADAAARTQVAIVTALQGDVGRLTIDLAHMSDERDEARQRAEHYRIQRDAERDSRASYAGMVARVQDLAARLRIGGWVGQADLIEEAIAGVATPPAQPAQERPTDADADTDTREADSEAQEGAEAAGSMSEEEFAWLATELADLRRAASQHQTWPTVSATRAADRLYAELIGARKQVVRLTRELAEARQARDKTRSWFESELASKLGRQTTTIPDVATAINNAYRGLYDVHDALMVIQAAAPGSDATRETAGADREAFIPRTGLAAMGGYHQWARNLDRLAAGLHERAGRGALSGDQVDIDPVGAALASIDLLFEVAEQRQPAGSVAAEMAKLPTEPDWERLAAEGDPSATRDIQDADDVTVGAGVAHRIVVRAYHQAVDRALVVAMAPQQPAEPEPAPQPCVWHAGKQIPDEVLAVVDDGGDQWTRGKAGADLWFADEWEPHTTAEMLAAVGPVREVIPDAR